MQITHSSITGTAPLDTTSVEVAKLSKEDRAVAGLSSSSNVNSTDTTKLSSAATLLSRALDGDSTPTAKTGQISAAIADGTYEVDPDKLASALIRSMLMNGVE